MRRAVAVIPYAWIVSARKSRYGAAVDRRVQRRRLGERAAWRAEDWLRLVAPGRTFLDVGGMWGIHGDHSFTALAEGARSATLVDLYATPEFEVRREESRGAVRFVQGEADSPEVIAAAGPHEVVWCWGVLYHHPNPHRLLESLHQVCSDVLVLESLTAPEVPGVPQAAVYLPNLPDRLRGAFDTTRRGGASRQRGISTPFDRSVSYANNFFAVTPSAVRALLSSAGFTVKATYPSPSGVLRHVFLAEVQRT